MNPRQELIDLFERTLPDERRVLARMARVEKKAHSPRPSWTLRLGLGLGGLGSLALATLVMTSGLARERSAATAESFPVSEAGRVRPRSEEHSEERGLEGRTPKPALAQSSQVVPSAGSAKSAKRPLSASANADNRVTPSADAPETVPGEPGPGEGTWKAVAEALRDGQKAKAAELIRAMAQSDDPEVRDNAQLIQLRAAVSTAAQLGQPLDSLQKERLTTLANQAATSSIRDSARKLLREVAANEGE
jgi:hypothetical protein